MKLALLLPGYIESPDYRHLVVVENYLKKRGYTTLRVDACNLWQTGDGSKYLTSSYIKQVGDLIESYSSPDLDEVVLIGHSLGCLVAAYLANINSRVTKIICLSPPISLDRSDHKWINGIRTSKKDLPNDANSFREFSVPFSFVEDRKQYSLAKSLQNNVKPVLVVIGVDDPSFNEVKDLVQKLNIKDFIQISNMGHDFRQSEELCLQVSKEILNFLK